MQIIIYKIIYIENNFVLLNIKIINYLYYVNAWLPIKFINYYINNKIKLIKLLLMKQKIFKNYLYYKKICL